MKKITRDVVVKVHQHVTIKILNCSPSVYEL